jgi:hypothetical protein
MNRRAEVATLAGFFVAPRAWIYLRLPREVVGLPTRIPPRLRAGGPVMGAGRSRRTHKVAEVSRTLAG